MHHQSKERKMSKSQKIKIKKIKKKKIKKKKKIDKGISVRISEVSV